MKNIFEAPVATEVIGRINKLSANTPAQWGKMNVAQMLAHCNVSYDMAYTNIYPKPGGVKRFFLKAFIKGIVVGEKVYKPNSRTAPEFLQVDEKNFEEEKTKLINYINRVVADGEASFENKESLSFGPLKTSEWNAMFYKHIDHHLNQFGV